MIISSFERTLVTEMKINAGERHCMQCSHQLGELCQIFERKRDMDSDMNYLRLESCRKSEKEPK
jgi:hypothetical protein